MSDAASVSRRPWSAGPALLATLAGAFALAVGVAVGDPGSGMMLPVALIMGLAVVGSAVIWPFAGILVLAFSVFFLMIVPVTAVGRNANPFDLVLLPLVVVSLVGNARREARARDAVAAGVAHDVIRGATRRISRAAILYFGLAALSLLPMAIRLGILPAFTSALSLTRGIEGIVLFPLALLWIRDESGLRRGVQAIFAAGWSFVVVNLLAVLTLDAPRAGIVWTVNDLAEPVAGPNEAAVGLLVLWALLTARQAVSPSWGQRVLMALVLLMLPLTQSRSGLLAFATFLLLSVRRLRWRWLLGVAMVISLLPLVVPGTYWERLVRSLTFERGSFEVFGWLVRLYDFEVAWRAFLDHALTGVGYLGYRFVSARYNDLGLVLHTAENYYLETLVGLGIVGFAALLLLLRHLYGLGAVVRKVAPAGTLAHELARRHAALLTALLVANMTGDVFVGLVPLGQLALWCALLVRAGHLAVPREETT